MIAELDRIVLTTDLPGSRLQAGDIGTIMLVHGCGDAYEVEFVTLVGETVAIVTVSPDQIRPVRAGEVPHARPLAAAGE